MDSRKADHCNRNVHNRCPAKEPGNICEDGRSFEFDSGFPGGDKYRGSDGSECKYDENGDLLPDDGSYSYNFTSDYSNPERFSQHVLQDVLPDLVWGKCYSGQTTVY